MTPFTRSLPWIVAALGGIYLAAAAARDVPKSQFDLDGFARLPVVDRGRIKPLDTLARTSLMIVSSRTTYTDANEMSQPAIRWLLEVMATGGAIDRGAAWKSKVFRIENDNVLSLLGLQPRSGLRYALEEFAGRVDKLEDEARRAQKVPKEKQDLYDARVLELRKHLEVYLELAQHRVPLAVPPTSPGGDDWQSLHFYEDSARRAAVEKVRGEIGPDGIDFAKLDELQRQELARKLDDALAAAWGGQPRTVHLWREMLAAYKDNQPERFNAALSQYRNQLPDEASPAYVVPVVGTTIPTVPLEVYFNRLSPFYNCAALYVMAFLLVVASWLFAPVSLSRAAFGLALFTLGVHTAALVMRMAIQGRPPVTNLYSSAVFIGWGCGVLGLILESVYRNGVGTMLASVNGFVTLIIANHLGSSGDTLEMMQAVLDTNFWLATHVTCVTLGYTATFAAGFLGMLFILRGVFTPSLDKQAYASLASMTYGVICFALLLSFVGTVLGGIWADQSWGRFWGWDPKENGALLIVLWNALILHARWGGMVKPRGVAILAVFGNIVTAWSWFGTNMLGVGLHSYGFMESAAFWMAAFMASQLAIMGLGMLPTRLWQSFGDRTPPPPSPPGRGRQLARV